MFLFDIKSLARKVEPQGELPGANELIRKTVKIAWPSVLESVMVCLVGMVDTMMVGTLGPSAIAAVGLTTQPKFIALAIFMSMNTAISAIVAHRRGQNDEKNARMVLVQALTIVLCLAAVISTLGFVFADPILKFAGTQADTHTDAVNYFRIIIAGLIFNVVMLVINAAQRGAGNTRISLKTNIASNAVNVILNYLLIGGKFGFPRLGVVGAAIATVIGSIVGCGMSIRSVLRKSSFLCLRSVRRISFDRETISSITKIGSSTMVEQVFLRIGFLICSLIVANLGTNSFAAHQICMNLISLSFTFGDGLGVASVALVGQSLGAKRRDLARIYMRTIHRIGILAAIILSIVFAAFGSFIYGLFTDDITVLNLCMNVLPISVTIVFFQIPQVIYGGSLRGAGDTKYMAIVSALTIGFVRPLSSWILCYPLKLGLVGAWLGIYLDQIFRMILAYLRIRGDKWMRHNV